MNGNALKIQRVIEKHKIIALDTAPFIYFIEDAAPYAALIEPAFTLLENHKLRAVTSVITLAEILTKPLAEKKFSLVDEIKFALKTFTLLSIVPIDERLAEAAALMRARYGMRLPDALQIAAAIQSEATLFVTNDKRLKKIGGIEVLALFDYLRS
jgi:predicted nucleic acid-binding protein